MCRIIPLIACLLCLVIGEDLELDPVEYIRRNGRPLHTYYAYFNMSGARLDWMCVSVTPRQYVEAIDHHPRALYSDVPIGLVPTDELIKTLCPNLSRVEFERDRFSNFEYGCLSYGGQGSNSLFMASPVDEGYCGANFPVYMTVVRVGWANTTVYHAPREELIRPHSERIGYVWKYPHLDPNELEQVQAEVTRLDRIFYRVITTRSSNYTYTYTLHHPTLQTYLGLGYYYNSVIGLVIGQNQLSEFLRKQCPFLQQVRLKKKDGLVTWIGYEQTSALSDQRQKYTDEGSFWCAPYMGYCGAYVNLQRLPSAKRDEDMFITSEHMEARRKATEYKFKVESPPPQTICWIWYPHRDTVNYLFEYAINSVKKWNLRLHRGHWTSGANKNNHAYTTRPGRLSNWEKKGFKKGSDLGYVVAEDKPPVWGCPNLIKMKIYQEEGGSQRTFIGGNYSPNIKTKGKWVLETSFYCAPYSGYCGATKLLWAHNIPKNYRDILYITNSSRALELEQDNKYSTYQLCYIWSI